MEFTGERFVPNLDGEIRLEHYHRYALISPFVKDKVVLDIACGTGYGSNVLYHAGAKMVFGVDISSEAVDYAKTHYTSDEKNINFIEGSVTKIPFPDNYFDIVVSYETIEHLLEQKEMLSEISRVLRPEGFACISSPNRTIFSEINPEHNQYHLKELDLDEFNDLLANEFSSIKYLSQRINAASFISDLNTAKNEFFAVHEEKEKLPKAGLNIHQPVYYIALCASSENALPEHRSSIYISDHYDLITSNRILTNWASDLRKGIDQRDSEISQKIQYIENINTQLDEIISWTKDLQKGIQIRDETITASQASIQDLTKKINNIINENETILDLKNEEISQLKEHNNSIKSTLNLVSTETNELKKSLTNTTDSLTLTVAEKNNLISHLGKLNKTIVDLQNELQDISTTPWNTLKNKMKRIKRIASSSRIFIASGLKAIKYYGSFYTVLKKTRSLYKIEGISGIIKKVRFFSGLQQKTNNAKLSEISDPLYNIKNNIEYCPLVSIIVPNYNHAQYLESRLKSIYAQDYKNFEVILLDDCSKDDSIQVLKAYADQYSNQTKLVINEKNSGGVFNQWKKGIEIAKGDIIWIAESDDFCTPNFLSDLVPYFENKAVNIAFCRTDFVNGKNGDIAWSIESYFQSANINIAENNFIKSAHTLVNQAWGVLNIIPNVSSAIFRNSGSISLFDDQNWKSMRLCGDWIFYLTIAQGGLVAYSKNSTNYYRQHSKNTSVTAQSENIYYQEHSLVLKTLLEKYWISPEAVKAQHERLYHHWITKRGQNTETEFLSLYNPDTIRSEVIPFKGNILMAGYAIIPGGGETFPITLANILKDHGYSVTFLNCNQEKTNNDILALLKKDIPVLEVENWTDLYPQLNDLAIDVAHSHHAWVDVLLSSLLNGSPNIKLVITTHGMYEMMEKDNLKQIMPILKNKLDHLVYTAEKNKSAFSGDFLDQKNARKIENALPVYEVDKKNRAIYSIPDDAFLLCMVARGVPEKGWEEAINAVKIAHSKSEREIHLIIIGNGPEHDRLKNDLPPYIHLLGFRSNIRSYFSMADMGLLPSRFKGESYPLALIDCLLSGRPVLASNVGQVEEMLSAENGLAGKVIQLDNWEIPVEDFANEIVKLANDKDYFAPIIENVISASEKFNPEIMFNKYNSIYQNLIQNDNKL
ncbi:glycosyltransferase [Chromobacterium sp. IIBBL 290-4]|uniref:glycosyltransferase n=1 Tax=Chromobacterium sp. IIBBL 290-4 TaxID=2953890 RepID=UPI0020B87854|nr:glycosyltransferase [Chromobacterium sp. IIBBL 290-4]UTH76566.1 glycosyltransferase [Chromobacterium sp. IIBBL 290-4]